MSDLPCRNCKGYTNCVLIAPIIQDRDLWWHFGEIRFCVFQLLWLISHRETLQSGNWPPEYREVEGSTQYAHEGKFVRPVVIIAEVMARIQMCGFQGEMLLQQVDDGRTYHEAVPGDSRQLHSLTQGAREALFYCKGFKRKRIPFKRWLRIVYYKRKSTPDPEAKS